MESTYSTKDYEISQTCIQIQGCPCQHYVTIKKTGETKLMYANQIHRLIRFKPESHPHFEYYANIPEDFGLMMNREYGERYIESLDKWNEFKIEEEIKNAENVKYMPSSNRLERVKAKHNSVKSI